jgi:putative chitinase
VAQRWVVPLVRAMQLAELVTHFRGAAFLAQIGHESGRLRYVREIWGPTPQQLRYEPGTTLARRLGNVYAGDGRPLHGPWADPDHGAGQLCP